MPTRYLNISRDLRIFFQDNEARYLSNSNHDPQAVEIAIYRWQGLHPNHPDFELSEKWLTEYKRPSTSEGLAEALGVSEHEAREKLPDFKAIRAEYQNLFPDLSDEEAHNRALETLRKARERIKPDP